MSARHFGKSEILGLLDIGSSKICCAIVERSWTAGFNSLPALRLLGVGHQRSRGIKAGMVVHLDQAEAAVRTAVGQAERMADVVLEDVISTVSCGRLKSAHLATHTGLDTGCVRALDLQRLATAAGEFSNRDDRALIHLNHVAYILDGELDVRAPERLAGKRLSANWHAVTADLKPIHNLSLLIDRADLGVRQFVPSGLAAALTATTSDERRLGVTCINFGAGVVDIASFKDGQFVFTDTIPFGGSHLTYDIARILTTPLAEAERIKTLYGTLVGAGSHENETLQYALAGELEGEAYHTTRAELHRILYPRVESQLCILRERIEKVDRVVGPDRNLVITGGASQLVGLIDMAAQKLERPVRIGSVPLIEGLPESFSNPAFAAAVGLACVAPTLELKSYQASAPRAVSGGYWARMEQWLRESF